VDIRVCGVGAVLLLNHRGVLGVELDGARRLEGIAARPRGSPLAIALELHRVLIPVLVHRREVGVVGVEPAEPAQPLLPGHILTQGLVATLLGRGLDAQSEAIGIVAPRDLVVALDELLDPVRPQPARALVLHREVGRAPALLPQPFPGHVAPAGRWVGNGRKGLLEQGGHGEEEVVPLPVGLGAVPAAPVDASAAPRDLSPGDQFRGVAAVPVDPCRCEEGPSAVAGHEAVRHATVVAVGQWDGLGLVDVLEEPEVQVGGLPAAADGVDDQRLAHDPVGILDADGLAVDLVFLTHVQDAVCEPNSVELGRRGGIAGELHPSLRQRAPRGTAIDAHRDLAEALRCRPHGVGDRTVGALIAELIGAVAGLVRVRPVAFGEVGGQDGLGARREGQSAGTGVQPGILARVEVDVALGPRLEGQLGPRLLIEGERVEEQDAVLGLVPPRDLDSRERERELGLLAE